MKALFGANRFLELALLAALSGLGNLHLNKSLADLNFPKSRRRTAPLSPKE
jgi:hypothetical protein